MNVLLMRPLSLQRSCSISCRYCRIRPLTSSERARGMAPIARCLPSGVVELNIVTPSVSRDSKSRKSVTRGPQLFQYDAVFTAECPQQQVFDEVQPLVQSAVDGFRYNGLCKLVRCCVVLSRTVRWGVQYWRVLVWSDTIRQDLLHVWHRRLGDCWRPIR